jgi:argininosuccinate lyase
VLRNIEFNAERARAAAIRDYTNATDLADYLVRKGIEFRKSHEIIGYVVVYAIEQGKELSELSLEEYQRFSPLFTEDLFAAISLESCLAGKNRTGGTAPAQVMQELLSARKSLTR